MNIRIMLLAATSVLPWVLKRFFLERVFGYKFSIGAKIGLAIVDARNVFLGKNCTIGAFTVIRNVGSLHLDDFSKIGTFNWIYGLAKIGGKNFSDEKDRDSSFILGKHSAVTSRHLIDCIDRVEIGAFTTIAGFRTQILTHEIDLRLNRQSCAPVTIGSYCLVGTGAIILKGSNVPDRCVIAAGSVVYKDLSEPGFVYGGNPPKKLREINSNDQYFNRVKGRVG